MYRHASCFTYGTTILSHDAILNHVIQGQQFDAAHKQLPCTYFRANRPLYYPATNLVPVLGVWTIDTTPVPTTAM